MRVAIMQPYFFPYIGYFQLLHAVDKFIVYDRIEYTKKGWINRNRILSNGSDSYITIPLKKDSDQLNIADRYVADTWRTESNRMLNRIREVYKKAPYFNDSFPIVQQCLEFDQPNLFKFLFNSISLTQRHLKLEADLLTSSDFEIEDTLRGQDKVIAICKAAGATHYVNPMGGVELYSNKEFSQHGLELSFLKTGDINYKQFESPFVPNLSIIDVLMFNSKEKRRDILYNNYKLV